MNTSVLFFNKAPFTNGAFLRLGFDQFYSV